MNSSGRIDTDDIKFSGYLEGDGDFRSVEVKALRDEADIIITNPPFSLFREFLAWVTDAGKKFAIIGNMNAITYKEVFPMLKDNETWLGVTHPKEFIQRNGTIKKFGNICWFTNLDHGQRHQPLQLDTMEHNLKFNKKLKKKFEKDYGKLEYPHYDNYDAIEVPFVECIPSDYDGVMGVPITFLDVFNPEQFEILGLSNVGDLLPGVHVIGPEWIARYRAQGGKGHVSPNMTSLISTGDDGRAVLFYRRLVIRPKRGDDN